MKSNLDDISHIESSHSKINSQNHSNFTQNRVSRKGQNREMVLRSMIQQLLNQQPDSLPDTNNSSVLQTHLNDLANSQTLSQKERKSVEKLCRIMNQNSYSS